MVTKSLAEAVILQSMEDLWDLRHRPESLKFFSGQEFRACARIAGMSTDDKLKLLNIVKKAVGSHKKSLSQAARNVETPEFDKDEYAVNV